MGKDNLLAQLERQSDLFIDEENGVVFIQGKMNTNTCNTSVVRHGHWRRLHMTLAKAMALWGLRGVAAPAMTMTPAIPKPSEIV